MHRRRGVLVIGVALALALAACGGGSGTRRTRSTTTSSSSTTTTSGAAATTTTTASPGTRCLVSQLALLLTAGSPGAGQRYATVTFTNNGTRPCTMFGYIGLQLLGAGGTTLPTNVVRDTDQPKATVTLAPGGKAFTTLHWGAIPAGSEPTTGPCEPTPQQVQITPPNETHFLVQPWTFDAVCDHGRIDTEPVRPGAGT